MLRSSLSTILLSSALALAFAACAASNSDSKKKDDDSSGQGGSSSSVGTGGQGGMATSGTGGNTSACPIDCTTIATPDCQQAVCNMQTKMCEIQPKPDGEMCDDGLFCTVNDSCMSGTCQGGGQNDCGMSPGDCDQLSCDETSQTCSVNALPDGTACVNSQDLCQENATCLFGTCQGTAKDCFFFPVPDDCHVAQCNPMNGMCEAVVGNEGLPCTDPMDLCTVSKTCAAGVCQGGNPKDCSALTMGCVLGVCDTANGQCTTQNLMNNDPCDDLNACTTGELCNSGMCTGGTPVTACINNDQCCPSGCNATNDTDCAIMTMDTGVQNSIYSSGSGTRGYWFTAPVAFSIKELRVPPETGASYVQNVQVVKFTGGPPPTYSASTTSFQTLFYVNNAPAGNWIVVNIPIAAGDHIGILGARGTTTMYNSYASGYQYNTTIYGSPVTLTRLIYQANLNTSQAGPLSQELAGSWTRVELKYGP